MIYGDKHADRNINRSGNKYKTTIENYGSKIRDAATGEISGFELIQNAEIDPNLPVTVFDDIFDGGRTVLECVKALVKLNPDLTINVLVPHFIGSNPEILGKMEAYAVSFFTTTSFQSESRIRGLYEQAVGRKPKDFNVIDIIELHTTDEESVSFKELYK